LPSSWRALYELSRLSARQFDAARVQRLIEWAKEDPRNEYAFWVFLWPRLLPLQFAGSGPHGEIELNVRLSSEELSAACRWPRSESTSRRCWSWRRRLLPQQ
jgi:hypothetical protein